MGFWDFVWIGWMAFLVVMDVIADHTPGATFSEHCRVWFKTPKGAITLGAFMLVLYLHFVVNWPVYPVIIIGVGIAHYVRRGYVMFRWDKWAEGAVFSGFVAIATSAVPLLSDGRVTLTEGVMMLGFFLGGVALYIKTHPVPEWDGVDRRGGELSLIPKEQGQLSFPEKK